jgi:hypothetical protein
MAAMTQPSNTPAAYWFPAKRYGWGWGPPITWQGWVVMAVFVVLLAAGAIGLLPTYGQLVFMLYSLGLCAALVGVCWLKGEPPRWRWGDSNQ